MGEGCKGDRDAIAILYFYGNGERIGIDGQVSYYLYPYDCNADDLDSTALNSKDLSQLLRAIRVSRLLVILDSCYSGGIDEIKGPRRGRAILKGEPQDADYQQLAQGHGRVIMASSLPTAVSRSSSALNHSLFTR